MCPFKSLYLSPLDKYLVVQLLVLRVVLFLTFSGTSILFSTVAAPVCIPTNSAQEFLFSTFLPTPVASCVVHFSHLDRYEVIAHCGFHLYFPDDEWCWASFHVSVGHLDIFFGEMSMSSAHFLIRWFVFWVLSCVSLYIFWLITLYQICHLQISSPI